jgi:hypothetical protein
VIALLEHFGDETLVVMTDRSVERVAQPHGQGRPAQA